MLAAFDAKDSRGRRESLDDDMMLRNLDPYLADVLKIRQSRSHRRLASKTQVSCSPDNPHVRTRIVHTGEVFSVSTAISEMLGLNTYLCQAIAEGHDIGHTPYGHTGEKCLSEIAGKEFRHEVFGVVIASKIEDRGLGLNLCYETLDGILHHSRGKNKMTKSSDKPQEYDVVMYADKIAYIFSDINDAIRYGYLTEEDLPPAVYRLGSNRRERTSRCIGALVEESREKGYVSFSEGRVYEVFSGLKDFMYKNVYEKIDHSLHTAILKRIYEFFNAKLEGIDPIVAVALLTDGEANTLGRYFLETRKPTLESISRFGLFEILPYIKGHDIDYTDPDLGW